MPVRVSRKVLECQCCPFPILRGERYYDGGYRRAHERCVESCLSDITVDTSIIQTALSEEQFREIFEITQKVLQVSEFRQWIAAVTGISQVDLCVLLNRISA